MADKEKAIAILKDEVQKHPEGYELYFDYREKISSKTIAEAFDKYCNMIQEAKEKDIDPDYPNDFKTFLEDYVYEEWDLWDASNEQVQNDFEYNRTAEELTVVNEYLEEECISLSEALYEQGFAGVSWDISDIFDDYKMNLMFTTPNEQDMDMGSIPDMFYDVQELYRNLRKESPESQDKHFDNALSYLVHQQGYKMSQVAEVYFTGEPTTDKFLQSVVGEISEFPKYSMAELTALVTLNEAGLQVLDQIAKGEGAIELSKDTMLGLYNEWQGTGSALEINLEKPFIVPADMVRNAQIEGQQSNSVKGYTVDDVYGLVGSCWDGTVKTTDKESDREQIEASMKNDVGNTLDIIAEKAFEAEKDDRDI